MSYGLLVKNDNSEILIDSTYRNLSKDEEGDGETITNGNHVFGDYYTRISIEASELIPLVLMRPDTDRFVSIRNYHKTGNNFDGFDVVTEADFAGAISTDIDWKSYRENRVASEDAYGMLIYNANGDLVFDAGISYFKIHSVHTISLNAPVSGGAFLGDSEDITHAGISNPFYILSPNAFYVTTSLATPPNIWLRMFRTIGVKKLSSTSVRVGWFTNKAEQFVASASATAQGLNPTMTLLVCKI